MKTEAVILLGAPGAGKGTIAAGMIAATNFIHLSTGDMLREAIKQGSALGQEAGQFMRQGNLVPDDLVVKMVAEHLRQGPAGARYLFDGFPRTLAQAKMLDSHFADMGARVVKAILLEVPEAVILDRLTGRRVCRGCGAVFHVRNIPPRQEGVCDQCGGELVQRPDDQHETILNRLRVYQQQTEDLINFYERQGLLARVNAAEHRQDTVAAVLRALRPGHCEGTCCRQ